MTESRDLIAYCGLYCGDCVGYRGKVADLARDLRKELRQAKFSKTAEHLAGVPFFATFKKYDDCYEVLGALVKFRCRHTCRGGALSGRWSLRRRAIFSRSTLCTQSKCSAIGRVLLDWTGPMKCQVRGSARSASILGTASCR